MTAKGNIWLQTLALAQPKLRKHILLLGRANYVLAVCELALNYELGNYKVKLSAQQRLYVRKLANRNIKFKQKQAFLATPKGLVILKALLPR